MTLSVVANAAKRKSEDRTSVADASSYSRERQILKNFAISQMNDDKGLVSRQGLSAKYLKTQIAPVRVIALRGILHV